MNIIFVCHGNICRSPMAEYIMKYLLEDYHTEGVYVSSAGVSSEENGNDIYPPAKRMLRTKGIPFSSHSAHRITDKEFNESDFVVALDSSNYRNLIRRFGDDRKIIMLLDRDVADPWYTDDFLTAYEDILEGCQKLLQVVEKPEACYT